MKITFFYLSSTSGQMEHDSPNNDRCKMFHELLLICPRAIRLLSPKCLYSEYSVSTILLFHVISAQSSAMGLVCILREAAPLQVQKRVLDWSWRNPARKLLVDVVDYISPNYDTIHSWEIESLGFPQLNGFDTTIKHYSTWIAI